MPSVKQLCLSCRWYDPVGQCRRQPQGGYSQVRSYYDSWTKQTTLSSSVEYSFPPTSPTDWCGEHRLDKKKLAEYLLLKG